jgi:hypothetical protein
MTLFHQTKAGERGNVIEQIAGELKEVPNTRRSIDERDCDPLATP